jgi:hypothetical protein
LVRPWPDLKACSYTPANPSELNPDQLYVGVEGQLQIELTDNQAYESIPMASSADLDQACATEQGGI